MQINTMSVQVFSHCSAVGVELFANYNEILDIPPEKSCLAQEKMICPVSGLKGE